MIRFAAQTSHTAIFNLSIRLISTSGINDHDFMLKRLPCLVSMAYINELTPLKTLELCGKKQACIIINEPVSQPNGFLPYAADK